ncbi:CAP domain-containing protein [Virgibacillus litoralis]|uniref:YkwD family protein n=1 Tax=Virgibacillus litoralis TaxID=578221 RepID=A0ABS4HCD6_9BACI|nr:CAP domain-containing protein [Virgibacillus litoralis]MBP1948152.1 putative YkwD family protein [Virgibacillus litoralis]
MFNKIIVTTLSAALLFGGAFQTSADASASAGQSEDKSNKVFYSINGQQFSKENLNNLLNNYFKDFQVEWNKIEKQQKQQDEQSNKEEQKQEKPEPKKEQPQENKQEQKQEQPEQPDKQEQAQPEKQEQPTEQTEAPAPKQQETTKQPEKQEQTQSQQLNEFEQQVVELTNKERTAQGLEALKVDTELSKVAREKSSDMSTNNYFSHNSPTYGSPFDMMKQFGISYQTAGENIAKGQRTPQEVVNGWMNSEGHRKNIMNSDFTHIGVGYVEQGNYWTQQFIGK